jgi:glycosyltransferase involved in cell wall biosynthesis
MNGVVPNDRLSLGVPGIDIALFHPGNYNQDGHILSVGRFADPRKNVRMLFYAYNWLRQSMPKAPHLILAGETGPSVEDWNLAVSLGISEYVEFHQNVLIEELARLYRGASLFVLSSNEEGLGIVILEAMASGIPVVATRCGGPETAVIDGETGYLTPVGDAKALAVTIQQLFAHPELRQRMGQAGRQRVEDHFSIEAAGKVYLEKYDELIEQKVR